jgi:isoleucyl-tRNA synthetase
LKKFTPDQKILPWEIVATFKGKEIEGSSTSNCFLKKPTAGRLSKAAPPVQPPSHFNPAILLRPKIGTGIVHTAPAFGADDFRVGKKYNIGILTAGRPQG